MHNQTHISKITIMGAGESGTGAAVLGKLQGFEVWVSDLHDIAPQYGQILQEHHIPFETGRHSEEKFLHTDLIIKSPGIPGNVPLLQRARDAGIPIVSEIEFASWFTHSKIIAITGSNGKTTTTNLIYHLLIRTGYNAAIAGNVGKSFAWDVAHHQCAWYVLEVSSFQLEDIDTFQPHITVLLNITPDHLDRYDYDMDLYAGAKFNIISNQGPGDVFIYYADDSVIQRHMNFKPIRASRKGYSQTHHKDTQAWIDGSLLKLRTGYTYEFDSMQLAGKHNQLNALAALLTAEAAGIDMDSLQKHLDSFEPVRHRLQHIGMIRGVGFINDSKATNVDAAYYALDGLKGPLIWIAGGIDKGNHYQKLGELVKQKVKGIIVLGQGFERLSQAFPNISITQTHSMEEAIHASLIIAIRGDKVLLSPACASFDLFRNYEDRGNQFMQVVNKYIASDQEINNS